MTTDPRPWRIYRTEGRYLDGHTGTEYATRELARAAADILWEEDRGNGWQTRGLIVSQTPEYAAAILAVTFDDMDACARCQEPDTYCRCYTNTEPYCNQCGTERAAVTQHGANAYCCE